MIINVCESDLLLDWCQRSEDGLTSKVSDEGGGVEEVGGLHAEWLHVDWRGRKRNRREETDVSTHRRRRRRRRLTMRRMGSLSSCSYGRSCSRCRCRGYVYG